MRTSFSDEMAMNWIADTLNEEVDATNTVAIIANIVRLTGRQIYPTNGEVENVE